MALRLRPLRLDDEADALRARAELEADGFTFLLDWKPAQPWVTYLQELERRRRGLDLPADRVPATFLAASVGPDLVGRVSIRHRLNDFLLNFGGHIGYAVRPSYRRQGFAGEILGQALIIARAEGVERVLVTCDEDNAISTRVIERHGGVLEDIRPDPDGPPKRRYWID